MIREIEKVGRYLLLHPVGIGTRSVVYAAEDPASGRRVAVRLPRDEYSDVEARFRSELEVSSLVRHPNVVEVLEAGREDEVGPFLVMELVEGATVAEIARSDEIDVALRLRILVQLANALEALHAESIVHGNLRPAKVLVDREGVVKLTGFGSLPVVPARGAWAYVAPEQRSGAPLDHGIDRYAFAVVAFELLTGQLPYAEESLSDLVYRIAMDPPMAGRRLEPGVRVVFERALARDPADRFPDVRSLMDALAAALEPDPTTRAGALAFVPAFARAKRARRRMAVLAAIGLAAISIELLGIRSLPAIETPRPFRVVRIDSDPAGATVLVDGRNYGTTPRRLVVDPSAQIVTLLKQGHRPAERLLAPDVTRLALALQPYETEKANVETVARRDPARPVAERAVTRPAAPPTPAGTQVAGLIPELRRVMSDFFGP